MISFLLLLAVFANSETLEHYTWNIKLRIHAGQYSSRDGNAMVLESYTFDFSVSFSLSSRLSFFLNLHVLFFFSFQTLSSFVVALENHYQSLEKGQVPPSSTE